VSLRKPTIVFSELAYGALDGVIISARVGPPVFGLGLLQAVPIEQLQRIADAPKPDGVRGRLNQVQDLTSNLPSHGRFGFKAGNANLLSQIAGAMHNDIGITSSLLPLQNCSATQQACLSAIDDGMPELSNTHLIELAFYLQHLAAPARRDRQDPNVMRGERLFVHSGCNTCHRPVLRTAKDSPPLLANLDIEPYTDLLLHDMGSGLADGRPEFAASGSEWRTTPLWGIGLTELISETSQYLHDGRARSLTEAILWHGGEAQAAQDRFARSGAAERDALLAFLQSL